MLWLPRRPLALTGSSDAAVTYQSIGFINAHVRGCTARDPAADGTLVGAEAAKQKAHEAGQKGEEMTQAAKGKAQEIAKRAQAEPHALLAVLHNVTALDERGQAERDLSCLDFC